MGHKFAEIVFTDAVKQVQETQGSRDGYAPWLEGEDRDSFYMATVTETGWPYLQHRGGPPGFLRVLDETTLGFADFRGNRQYVSVGNLTGDDRVALFLMDYPNKKRLKILGRVRLVGTEESEVLAKLDLADYRARVERGFVIQLEAFDWNCPQHITQRLTLAELGPHLTPLREELARLRADNESLRARLGEDD
jgi:predicted pyridoxine 5'-phosphate oxidase superfamily flavin-nucleotide-binding protein